MNGVVATVKMEREAIPLLLEDTRFWVVTARIGGGGVSGLDTILSGAYIELSPGESTQDSRRFVGLDEPPLTPAGAPGLRLSLVSDESSSLSSGDTVVYKGFTVGRIESVDFDTTRDKIHYSVFIDAPYHVLIDSSVRFWDVSGVSISTDTDGIDVSIGSIDTIIYGGITFATPPQSKPGKPVQTNHQFNLFSSYQATLDEPYQYRAYFVAMFTQSLRGLAPGAPVEYRGIRVGHVERIMLEELIDWDQGKNQDELADARPIPVLFYVEPGLYGMPDTQKRLTGSTNPW